MYCALHFKATVNLESVNKYAFITEPCLAHRAAV